MYCGLYATGIVVISARARCSFDGRATRRILRRLVKYGNSGNWERRWRHIDVRGSTGCRRGGGDSMSRWPRVTRILNWANDTVSVLKLDLEFFNVVPIKKDS